jgi:hypothetical protein
MHEAEDEEFEIGSHWNIANIWTNEVTEQDGYLVQLVPINRVNDQERLP